MKSIKIFDSSTLICIFQEAKFPKLIDNCKKRDYKIVIPFFVYEEIKDNENTYSEFKKYKDYIMIKNSSNDVFNGTVNYRGVNLVV